MMKKLLEISLFTHDGEDVLLALAYLQRTFCRKKGNGQPECTISEQARGIGKSLGSKTGARFTARPVTQRKPLMFTLVVLGRKSLSQGAKFEILWKKVG
jgi:hypothetical protein